MTPPTWSSEAAGRRRPYHLTEPDAADLVIWRRSAKFAASRNMFRNICRNMNGK
jgi:hypothetical protein